MLVCCILAQQGILTVTNVIHGSLLFLLYKNNIIRCLGATNSCLTNSVHQSHQQAGDLYRKQFNRLLKEITLKRGYHKRHYEISFALDILLMSLLVHFQQWLARQVVLYVSLNFILLLNSCRLQINTLT